MNPIHTITRSSGGETFGYSGAVALVPHLLLLVVTGPGLYAAGWRALQNGVLDFMVIFGLAWVATATAIIFRGLPVSLTLRSEELRVTYAFGIARVLSRSEIRFSLDDTGQLLLGRHASGAESGRVRFLFLLAALGDGDRLQGLLAAEISRVESELATAPDTASSVSRTGPALAGPDLSIGMHVALTFVFFFGGALLLMFPMFRLYGVLLDAMKAYTPEALWSIGGLIICFSMLALLHLPCSLFLKYVPALCPTCGGDAYATAGPKRYECRQCGHVETTAFSIGRF